MSHAANAHNHAEAFDAHGHKDHGHVIVNIWTLRFVLLTLLFFTFATVGAATLEQFVSSLFNVIIPQWINVFVALSIAVVKTTLVVMFFMQLRYDNPLNTMIFIFTVLTVAFFLGFTAIDAGNRKSIDTFKGRYIHEGGTGLGGKMQANESIVDWARRAGADQHGHDAGHAEHGHGHKNPELMGSITDAGFRRDLPHVGSSSDRSRPVRGLTLPGFAEPAADHGHDDGHAPAPAPAPAPEKTDAPKPAAH
jgi:cytochrome c oxidase subunit 4